MATALPLQLEGPVMLKTLLIAACGVLLLTACEQKQAVVAASSPQTPQPSRNFMLFFAYDQATLGPTTKRSSARPRGDQGAVERAGDRRWPCRHGGQRTLQPDPLRAPRVGDRDALVHDGVSEAAITVMTRGKEELLVPTTDRVREPKNRRVEIMVQ